ncbi:hypothetical protein C8R45DRAFT_1112119 [Mycena sanguinolenta]|nr:hypothetical protein C8R45DRAFT_1112119 [Mycena sanguinolenta]
MQLNITTLLAVAVFFTMAATAPITKRGITKPPICLECVVTDEPATVPNLPITN